MSTPPSLPLIRKASEGIPRLTMILWGEAGTGKTALAATAPGKKLLVLFDPEGDASIKHIPDVDVYDLSASTKAAMPAMHKSDPFAIGSLIAEHKYDTIIIDSITKVSQLALGYAVATLPSNFKASDDNPTQSGYGKRNRLVENFMIDVLRMTSSTRTNVIFITHEGAADRNDDGVILSVNMLLGGQLPNLLSKEISEVWHIGDQNGKRRIAVRPERMRTPMKSRMFDLEKGTGFEWKYSPANNSGHTITSFWQKWIDGKFAKIALPV
jgi:hypothetical protein